MGWVDGRKTGDVSIAVGSFSNKRVEPLLPVPVPLSRMASGLPAALVNISNWAVSRTVMVEGLKVTVIVHCWPGCKDPVQLLVWEKLDAKVPII